MTKQFLGVLTRCRDEYFIHEFCQHYLDEGADEIIVIDDDSVDKSIYASLDAFGPRVRVIYARDVTTPPVLNAIFRGLKDAFEWILFLDVDEFVTTRRNPALTLRETLQTTFSEADCVKIPWIMMACDGREESPASLVLENTKRWNHDLKHPHPEKKFRCRYDMIEVKCVFRPEHFIRLRSHHPMPLKRAAPVIVDSIDARPAELDTVYHGLHEPEIARAHLICHHFRIISVDNCRNKLRTNKFYIRNGYDLDTLMASDHPDLVDDSLKRKTEARRAKAGAAMLDLRPNCEKCDCDLPPDSDTARICSFESTFCASCAAEMKGICPNCGGGLQPRPVRPSHLLEWFPARTGPVRNHQP